MKDELIQFETAVLAKEKGFNWETLNCFLEDGSTQISSGDENDFEEYNHNLWTNYSRPTQSLLQKWLREVHLLDIRISNYFNKAGDNILIYNQEVFFTPDRFEETPDDETEYETYEQALSVSILECLKLIKNESN